jgi:YebC/PmpR family DNA-binding regulatory protein
VLIEALTDNRNRTAADMREAFSKNGGNLGETGCVSWMFDQKGVVTLTAAPAEEGRKRNRNATSSQIDEDALLEASLEGGAEFYELTQVDEAEGAEVFTEVANLENLSQVLKEKGYYVHQAELRWIPNNTMEVTDPDQARSLLKLMDALEDSDDVQNVTANFEMAEDLMSVTMA